MSGQLQAFAVQVAARAKNVPVDTVSGGLNAGTGSWTIFVEMIMGFIAQMLEQCQKTEQDIAESAREPSRSQRVWFRAYVSANWRDRSKWGWRNVAHDTADAAIEEAAKLPVTALVGIVEEVRNTPL
jgi:hypothetical protein